MKMIFALAMLIAQSAMAIDFYCRQTLPSGKERQSQISSWPTLRMVVSDEAGCTTGGSSSSCTSGINTTIASNNYVCYEYADVKNDCKLSEGKDFVEVVCNNKRAALFRIDSAGDGTVDCEVDGVVRKTWKLGACKEVN